MKIIFALSLKRLEKSFGIVVRQFEIFRKSPCEHTVRSLLGLEEIDTKFKLGTLCALAYVSTYSIIWILPMDY